MRTNRQQDRRTGGRADGLILVVSSLLAAGCASSIPIEVRIPRPQEVLLQAWTFSTCLELARCPATHRRGHLVFADTDSLVMFDNRAMERVAIRPGPGVILQVYRGQRSNPETTMKGATKGALQGAAAGLAEALLVGGLFKLLGGDVDMTEAMRSGVALGAGTGAFAGGLTAAQEGEAVWERLTLLQLRQHLCRCADPGAAKPNPATPLIP